MVLKLIEYIENNSNWETLIAEKPYYITVKRKDNFIMFNYSQIDSDFYNPIVKECRGIILEDHTYKPVCVPFYKFGNYGEGYVDQIDWNTARVQEKVDGSLIKLWNYNGEWHVSTNGMIDANDAEIASDISPYRTFYDLFCEASKNSNLNMESLDKNYTWMFELISPFNRVVVPYTEISIRHIGTRDNKTLQELDIDIGIQKPKSYGFTSLNECIQMASKLPFSEEGYVVVDKNWNRNKVKSPAYVAAHHLKNNGVVTKSRVVEIFRNKENEEFLNYYPEYTDVFNNIENALNKFLEDMNLCIDLAEHEKKLDDRKRFADFAKNSKCPPLLFNWLDGRVKTAQEWLWNQTSDKIVRWIGV